MFGRNLSVILLSVISVLFGSAAFYLLVIRNKLLMIKIYEKAKLLAGEVIDYVEQISKKSKMTDEDKKKLAVQKLKFLIKQFYDWDAPEDLLDLAIEIVIYRIHTIRDASSRRDK